MHFSLTLVGSPLIPVWITQKVFTNAAVTIDALQKRLPNWPQVYRFLVVSAQLEPQYNDQENEHGPPLGLFVAQISALYSPWVRAHKTKLGTSYKFFRSDGSYIIGNVTSLKVSAATSKSGGQMDS